MTTAVSEVCLEYISGDLNKKHFVDALKKLNLKGTLPEDLHTALDCNVAETSGLSEGITFDEFLDMDPWNTPAMDENDAEIRNSSDHPKLPFQCDAGAEGEFSERGGSFAGSMRRSGQKSKRFRRPSRDTIAATDSKDEG